MNVAAITGGRQAWLVEREKPAAHGPFAVVRVRVAPMCTEYKAYRDGQESDRLGHEAAGEVVEVAQEGPVSVGDRVVVMPQYPCGKCELCLAGEFIHCEHNVDVHAVTGNETGRATMAEYVIKQHHLLVPIPDGMSYEHASMACCGLGPTFGAMERMRVDAFDTVLIVGLGPVGLGGVINGAYRGARVIGVETNAYRAELARELGAEVVIDPAEEQAAARLKELTAGRGVDCGIDCTGVPAGQLLLLDAAKRKGRTAMVGEGGDVTINVAAHLLRKGLVVHGVWHYNLGLAPKLMRMIARLGPKLDRLITHSFPLEKLAEAFELQLTGQCGKVLLKP